MTSPAKATARKAEPTNTAVNITRLMQRSFRWRAAEQRKCRIRQMPEGLVLGRIGNAHDLPIGRSGGFRYAELSWKRAVRQAALQAEPAARVDDQRVFRGIRSHGEKSFVV